MRFKFLILSWVILPVAVTGGIFSLARQDHGVSAPQPVFTPEATQVPNQPSPNLSSATGTGVAEISQPVAAAYPYGNPAGCAESAPEDLSSADILAKIQRELGDTISLADRRQYSIWNGPTGGMLDVSQDQYAFEFSVDEFRRPFTYRADRMATIFLTNGFVVWLRQYGGHFRLLAVRMSAGVEASAWGGYVSAYWQQDGLPNDETIYPVMKKLPCQWVVDRGYVSSQTLRQMFPLDWHMPDYLQAGRKYLATSCHDAYQVARGKINYPDASTMCGPLAWKIINDVDGFPYEIGSWTESAFVFTGANPRANSRPWGAFDPETFDVTHIEKPMPGFDFDRNGNLFPGDIIYSFSTEFYNKNDQRFDHIFVVAGIDANNARLSISNMVQNYPVQDCSISEIVLYTPGDLQNGVINHEWNGFGFGKTGTSGFDIFRWKWISYHLNGQPMDYTVRWGDTLETIGFDWKVSPASIADFNHLAGNAQLEPGQKITLPVALALTDTK